MIIWEHMYQLRLRDQWLTSSASIASHKRIRGRAERSQGLWYWAIPNLEVDPSLPVEDFFKRVDWLEIFQKEEFN